MPKRTGRTSPSVPEATEATQPAEPNRPTSEPAPVPAPLRPKETTLGHSNQGPRKEPREWFARIRIREDRLARLWVANLTSRDVVVWSPKERRWIAFLAIPELRKALRIAELERASNPRKTTNPPPSIPPARLSKPPTTWPPSPPPHTPRNAAVSIAGELRLLSIAQGAARDGAGHVRESLLPPAPSTATERRLNAVWRKHFSRPQPARRRPFDRLPWKALDRLLWVTVGIGLVWVLSRTTASDEVVGRFEPASVLLAADPSGNGTEAPPTEDFARWFTGNTSTFATPRATRDSTSNAHCLSMPDPAETALEPRTTEEGTDAKQRKKPRHIPAATPEPPPVPSEPPLDFDLAAARLALIGAAITAKQCPGRQIQGKVIVTFEPSGFARAVDLPLVIGDDVDRDCLARTFKNVRVPPFTGSAVAVKKDF